MSRSPQINYGQSPAINQIASSARMFDPNSGEFGYNGKLLPEQPSGLP